MQKGLFTFPQLEFIAKAEYYGGNRENGTLLMGKQRKPSGYWDDFTNVRRHLLSVIEQHSTIGHMISVEQLKRLGHGDLVHAITQHGGVSVVAERLQLQLTVKPFGYWTDFVHVEEAIKAYSEQYSLSGVMPTTEALKKHGYGDVANAIVRHHGGRVVVAERLGLDLAASRKPEEYWTDFTHVAEELRRYVDLHGNAGIMPTLEELRRSGHSSLAYAISRHGGIYEVAERLQLKLGQRKKVAGAWDNFDEVAQELHAVIEELGTPGIVPTQAQLTKMGRSDLAVAITRKHGGLYAAAKRLGLRLSHTKKEAGHWDGFPVVEHEVLVFIEQHGTPGIMPTQEEFQPWPSDLGYS